jgi:hypothetical protein
MTYLGSWALVAPIIAFKFLMDFCMFLLEAITTSSLVHLRLHMSFFYYGGGMCTPF